MVEEQQPDTQAHAPVAVFNATGTSPWLLVCEHASNYIPASFRNLGLDAGALTEHIAWDPGAVEVARGLASLIDAPLVESRLSRLIIDCNRALDAPDLVPELCETTVIPANRSLDPRQREERIALSHRPFHAQIERLITTRMKRGLPSWLVTIHSFTPVYRGVARPWQVGIIHDNDTRVAAPLIAALREDATLDVGVNEPYSPADGVYYTLQRHARPHNKPCVMIEIRNNEIADARSQAAWAGRFAAILKQIQGFPGSGQTGQRA